MKAWQGLLSLVFCLFILTSFASCQSPATPPTTPPATAPSSASVGMSGLAFKPDTVTIAAGGTVTWTNQEFTPHTVTSDSGAFDSGTMGPNATFSHTFDQKGTFSYHCSLHASMKGKVIVQ